MANVNDFVFTEEEMAVDDRVGYPKAYAKLCLDRGFGPFRHGPPFTFTPYRLSTQEEFITKEVDDLFPVIDTKLQQTSKPNIFVSLLWKQLNHLGNAGFDPEVIRVDPYGNVLYYHADAASPLAWEIDHWFPCSRGGLTIPSNLRILQWQVCKRKNNKLEFLIPWWDFQLGISINQFLFIFASSNSDFRRRGYSWLFSEGENQELHASQTVDCHTFPKHFLEEGKLGMAPAALVLCRKDSSDYPLRSLDFNRRPRSSTPILAVKKTKQQAALKENNDPSMDVNPHQAIAMARDSLKQRETAAKMQLEIQKLDLEASELHQRSEEEKVSIKELEIILMKKQKRAEKCRRLAESQSSYRVMLEKMIRDAMHQNVVFKEQMRLNQAAASALLARLEAQKALCDSAERDLLQRCKQRDELEKQFAPETPEHSRKRSRANDTEIRPLELPSPEIKSTPRKELRKFLEEEKRASAESMQRNEEARISEDRADEKLEIEDGGDIYNIHLPIHRKPEEEKDEKIRKERGKANLEKWLMLLMEMAHEEDEKKAYTHIYPHREIKVSKADQRPQMETTTPIQEQGIVSIGRRMSSPDDRFRRKKNSKERELQRCESARGFQRIPSSPSLIFEGMKKRVECLGKKPSVLDDADENSHELPRNGFIRSSFKAMKKVIMN